MIVDQNTIRLEPSNGFYEEYILSKDEEGNVLPGAVVTVVPFDEDPELAELPGVPGTQVVRQNLVGVQSQVPTDMEIDDVEMFVVIENALVGKGLNHKAIPGEVTLLHRPNSGDRLLMRCVEGSYKNGDPLFLIQTPNGMYVTNESGAGGSEVKAHAIEQFVCPATDMPANQPPFFFDAVDTSTSERPMRDPNLNGALVNLLRVRIA